MLGTLPPAEAGVYHLAAAYGGNQEAKLRGRAHSPAGFRIRLSTLAPPARSNSREVFMRKKVIAAVLGAIVVTAVVTRIVVAHQYEESGADPHSATIHLQSAVLAEARDVIVSLPVSYPRDPSRRYPVLYVLDGSSQATHTAESARLLARIGVMPEILVIGIPSSTENRARDYTPPYMRVDAEDEKAPMGEANRFLRFIETELIPHVDRQYRTTSMRILAGNSRGGVFVVYSLLEKPDLFVARFAFSPALWRDDDRLVKELAKSLRSRAIPPTSLYLSLGDGENEKMTRAFRKAEQVLQTSASPLMRWRSDTTRGARHSDNAVLSTPVALHECFRAR
jgi:predicted alpha/beta superfamily hydrolase